MASWTQNETPTRVTRSCDKSEAQGTVSVGTRSAKRSGWCGLSPYSRTICLGNGQRRRLLPSTAT